VKLSEVIHQQTQQKKESFKNVDEVAAKQIQAIERKEKKSKKGKSGKSSGNRHSSSNPSSDTDGSGAPRLALVVKSEISDVRWNKTTLFSAGVLKQLMRV